MQFTEAVVNLKFDEEPKYEAYMRLFEPLCGSRTNRPIQTNVPAPKVGQKRARDPNDDILLDSTGNPKKKARPQCDFWFFTFVSGETTGVPVLRQAGVPAAAYERARGV